MPETIEELAELTANFPNDGKVRLVTSNVPELYDGETLVLVSEPFAIEGLAFLPFAGSDRTCDPSIKDKGPWLKLTDGTSVSLHTGQVYENEQAVNVAVNAGVQDDEAVTDIQDDFGVMNVQDQEDDGVTDVEGEDEEEELDG